MTLEYPESLCGIDISVEQHDIRFDNQNDFVMIYGYNNLKQAIENRCATYIGFFTNFPYYGSKIDLLLGSKNDDFALQFLRQEVYNVLRQDPRIGSIDAIQVSRKDAQTLTFSVKVVPISTNVPLNMVWDYMITGG